MRILLVEDNADHCELMLLALTGHDPTWCVEGVRSGEEALRRLAEEAHDLVLLDYSLPGRDGLTVLEDIQRVESPPPAVIVTGLGNEQVAVEAMKRGAYDYVVKTEGFLALLPVVARRTVETHQLVLERRWAEEERQRLINELHAGRQQLEALSRRLVEVQEAERNRIAYELHEQIVQSLTMTKFVLDQGASLATGPVKANLDEALMLVKDLSIRVRDLSFDLRPPALSDLGLLSALEWLCERYNGQAEVRVTLENSRLEGLRFVPEVETTAYRVVQAALDNVSRHAEVDQATVYVHADDEWLSLQIQDQGVGFEPETAFVASNPRSLAGMRERVAWLGGQLKVESARGAGTRVLVEFPLRST